MTLQSDEDTTSVSSTSGKLRSTIYALTFLSERELRRWDIIIVDASDQESLSRTGAAVVTQSWPQLRNETRGWGW